MVVAGWRKTAINEDTGRERARGPDSGMETREMAGLQDCHSLSAFLWVLVKTSNMNCRRSPTQDSRHAVLMADTLQRSDSFATDAYNAI